MVNTTEFDNGTIRTTYRAFGTLESGDHPLSQMGNELTGNKFSFHNVNMLKDMLFAFYPRIVRIDVNQYGFGYLTCHYENGLRRHLHWFELATAILPKLLLKNNNSIEPNQLNEFYQKVFVQGRNPVNLLYNVFKENDDGYKTL